jgi:hypothetical protein
MAEARREASAAWALLKEAMTAFYHSVSRQNRRTRRPYSISDKITLSDIIPQPRISGRSEPVSALGITPRRRIFGIRGCPRDGPWTGERSSSASDDRTSSAPAPSGRSSICLRRAASAAPISRDRTRRRRRCGRSSASRNLGFAGISHVRRRNSPSPPSLYTCAERSPAGRPRNGAGGSKRLDRVGNQIENRVRRVERRDAQSER